MTATVQNLLAIKKQDCMDQACRVWLFENTISWKAKILEHISEYIDENVIKYIKGKPIEEINHEDLTWLNEAIKKVKDKDVVIESILAKKLPQIFCTIRAYHGARPTDINSYLTKGIMPRSMVNIDNIIRNIFNKEKFSQQQIDKIIDETNKSTGEDSLVYFHTSQDFLKKYCSHYMCNGSEAITNAINTLENRETYMNTLKNTGTPTIFVCDIPLKWIKQEYLKEYASRAIQVIIKSELSPESRQSMIDMAVTIKGTLPPTMIIGHTEYLNN